MGSLRVTTFKELTEVRMVSRKNDDNSWSATTFIYGFIGILYVCLAVVLVGFMMNRRNRTAKVDKDEAVLVEDVNKQMNLEEDDDKKKEEKKVSETEKEKEIVKETTFENPTKEEIKQLCDEQKIANDKKNE